MGCLHERALCRASIMRNVRAEFEYHRVENKKNIEIKFNELLNKVKRNEFL